MGVSVRRASVQDAAALMRLRLTWFRAAADVPEGEWFTRGVAWFATHLDPHQGSGFAAFVADTGCELVAFATGHTAPRLPAPDGLSLRGRIDSAYTLPGYRRRGLASRCVAGVRDWLEAQGAAVVEVTAGMDAAALYTGLGFTPQNGTHLRWSARSVGSDRG